MALAFGVQAAQSTSQTTQAMNTTEAVPISTERWFAMSELFKLENEQYVIGIWY
jgi:hypothetical protein